LKQYKYSTFADIVKKFNNKKVMVIGDLLLDQYIWGDVSRISPEAPVPVVWVNNEEYMPGGACNVANNLARLGAEVSLVGVVGKDERGEILKSLLKEKKIGTDGIVMDRKRPTILKTRVIAHSQQVVRIDKEEISGIEGKDLEKLRDHLRRSIPDVDGIIIEDYGKGLITPALLKMVVPLARKYKKIVAVDPKENHFSYYKGVNVITPNHHEAGKAVGFNLSDDGSLAKAGSMLLKKLRADVVLITLGERGMMVFRDGMKPKRIPTVSQAVFDVSGAGDTVIAVYTLSVISGGSPIIAAHIANCAAGVVVGKVGVVAVEKDELMGRLKKETGRAE